MGKATVLFITGRRSLTPNDDPPWAPGGGTLDMEGPMPGAPLGNKPRAFRFKPGIRLDWSWREMRAFPLTQYVSQVVLLIKTSDGNKNNNNQATSEQHLLVSAYPFRCLMDFSNIFCHIYYVHFVNSIHTVIIFILARSVLTSPVFNAVTQNSKLNR